MIMTGEIEILSDRPVRQWRTELVGSTTSPPLYFEFLTSPDRIPCSMEYTSMTNSENTGFTHLQIERNP
jgi:hypothetical protein